MLFFSHQTCMQQIYSRTCWVYVVHLCENAGKLGKTTQIGALHNNWPADVTGLQQARPVYR